LFGNFGSQQFASSWYIPPAAPVTLKKIALLGDTSSHGGTITDTNQDGTFTVGGIPVAVEGATLNCPVHGAVPIIAVTVKSYQNGKLIATENAIAGCGALIQPLDRGVTVE
jgi:uncharacterized Zn-binding protein involved in type VI secretion